MRQFDLRSEVARSCVEHVEIENDLHPREPFMDMRHHRHPKRHVAGRQRNGIHVVMPRDQKRAFIVLLLRDDGEMREAIHLLRARTIESSVRRPSRSIVTAFAGTPRATSARLMSFGS